MPRRGVFKGNVSASGATLHGSLAIGEGFHEDNKKGL